MWSAPSGGSETVYRARTFWCLSSRAGSMPAGGTPTFFFSLPSSSFFLISPRLDFSFYNVVIPELCFLFYNNRGHYTGLILVCIPLSVFKYFKLPPRAQRPSGERPEALTQEENGLSYGQQTLTISVLLVLEEKRKRSEFPKTMDKC